MPYFIWYLGYDTGSNTDMTKIAWGGWFLSLFILLEVAVPIAEM